MNMTIKEIVEEIKDLKILIVEDADDIRAILSATLTKIAGSIITASDGVEGLEEFSKNDIVIVLTDIRMPNMSGNMMIDDMKELKPNIPIIAISGHQRFIEKNNKADCFLSKPIKFDKLILSIYDLTKK